MTDPHFQIRDEPAPPIPPQLAAHAVGNILVDPNGPLYDSIAQALAFDAANAVSESLPWNTMGTPGYSAYQVRVGLSKHMQINGPDEWVSHLGMVLDAGFGGDLAAIIEIRTRLMRGAGQELPPAAWVGAVHDWLQGTDHSAAAHDQLDLFAPAITEVDGWLHEVGLLPANALTPSVIGPQASRAVEVIRLGAQSGYADRASIIQGLLAVSDLVGRQCASWREYAIAYLAGTALLATEGDRRRCFDTTLSAVATCLSAPDSPWQVLRFPLPELTITDFEERTWDS